MHAFNEMQDLGQEMPGGGPCTCIHAPRLTPPRDDVSQVSGSCSMPSSMLLVNDLQTSVYAIGLGTFATQRCAGLSARTQHQRSDTTPALGHNTGAQHQDWYIKYSCNSRCRAMSVQSFKRSTAAMLLVKRSGRAGKAGLRKFRIRGIPQVRPCCPASSPAGAPRRLDIQTRVVKS